MTQATLNRAALLNDLVGSGFTPSQAEAVANVAITVADQAIETVRMETGRWNVIGAILMMALVWSSLVLLFLATIAA